MGDDEFKDFDPRLHWAEDNNELHHKIIIGKLDQKEIERLAKYLQNEHTVADIILALKLKRGEVIRLFGFIRTIKNLSLERRECKSLVTYQIKDFRKKEN